MALVFHVSVKNPCIRVAVNGPCVPCIREESVLPSMALVFHVSVKNPCIRVAVNGPCVPCIREESVYP